MPQRTTPRHMLTIVFAAIIVISTAHAEPSTIETSIAANLRPFTAVVPIPQSFDEHGHENELPQGLRFDLRRLRGPKYSVLPDGAVEVYAKYYGDIQEKLLISLCHLGNSPGVWQPDKNWVLVEARVSVRPNVMKDGNQWILRAADVKAAFGLAPGSDSHCTIANFNVEGKLNAVLSGPLQSAAINALQGVRVPVPLDTLWQTINRPYMMPVSGIPGGAIACVSANLAEIILGRLHSLSDGSIDSVELPLTLKLSPVVSITQATSCPATQASLPNIHSL